jgi:O-antigen biosynthesis protein
LQPAEPVTLVVLTGARYRNVEGRGKLLLVDNFVDSIISKSTYPRYHLLVVDDNANLPPHVRHKVERAGGSIVSFPMPQEFNFSAKVNFALSQVTTEHVILLNDDLEVIREDWIEALLAFSRRSEIGAVGAKLLFPNGRIQHAGVVLGMNWPATHIFHGVSTKNAGYCGYTDLVRNYSAVTAAVIATRMSLVRQVGGFDESFAVDFNDIDFCLRLRSAGYRIVYTPYAQLYHFEGSSFPRQSQSASEKAAFILRWRPQIERDPYYHTLLPRDRSDCVLTEWRSRPLRSRHETSNNASGIMLPSC